MRRSYRQVDFLSNRTGSQKNVVEILDRRDPWRMSRSWIVSVRFVWSIIGPTGYRKRVQWREGKWLAWCGTYMYRAVRKPALRNERSPIGLLACPLCSFISIFLPSPPFPVSPVGIRLYDPVSVSVCHSTLLFRCQFATRFTAGGDSDACVSDKNRFCTLGPVVQSRSIP